MNRGGKLKASYCLIVATPAELSGTEIASQNRSDHGGCKQARSHSAAEIAGFFASAAAEKIASR